MIEVIKHSQNRCKIIDIEKSGSELIIGQSAEVIYLDEVEQAKELIKHIENWIQECEQ